MSARRADDLVLLAAGTDHDVMKGALYVLGSKATQNLAILDWRFGPRYLHWILQCSHQERPSVQNLVKTITHDFIIRIAEPSTLKATVESEALNRSAAELEKLIAVAQDDELLSKVSHKAQQRIEQKNEAYDKLVSRFFRFDRGSARASLLTKIPRNDDSCRNCSNSLRTLRRTGDTLSSRLDSCAS